VDHDRTLTRVIGCDVGDVEVVRRLKVQLDGRHLMGTPDRVLRLHRDLWSIKRTAAGIHDEVKTGRLPDLGEDASASAHSSSARSLCLEVASRVPDRSHETKVTKEIEHEVERSRQPHLSFDPSCKNVRVVLGHAPNPRQPGRRPTSRSDTPSRTRTCAVVTRG